MGCVLRPHTENIAKPDRAVNANHGCLSDHLRRRTAGRNPFRPASDVAAFFTFDSPLFVAVLVLVVLAASPSTGMILTGVNTFFAEAGRSRRISLQ
jgi:hypothetical protein